jgi:hypothetical protein
MERVATDGFKKSRQVPRPLSSPTSATKSANSRHRICVKALFPRKYFSKLSRAEGADGLALRTREDHLRNRRALAT